MEDTIDQEKTPIENNNQNNNKDDGTQYVDCIRLVDGGHIRRFENVVSKFDIIQYESNDDDDGPTKPLIFYAIEHNDEPFVKFLLEMEVPLDKSYSVSRTIRFPYLFKFNQEANVNREFVNKQKAYIILEDFYLCYSSESILANK
jgi:hypothetical protein